MGDLETQAGQSERTPLLAQHQQPKAQSPTTQQHPADNETGAETTQNAPTSHEPDVGDEQHEAAALLEPQPQEPRRQRTRAWWFWRILWAVFAALLLAVFIKGWVDAKDVDFDVGGALKRALGGGLSGAAAMVLQVLLLMVSATPPLIDSLPTPTQRFVTQPECRAHDQVASQLDMRRDEQTCMSN